ncbi:unnamed protein product [Phaedon cochleariae]|uniref:Glycolipid transfer protein domain-containing protein n=1 Tax=Phaedon cochleariae TaxID=80249 RepID=A0A9P0DTE5_PHACE|nr:unnamed protein product [Phaedon cochleariae]
MSQDVRKFDIKIVSENFEAALHKEDDVQIQEYLDSFEELNRFFTLMGSIFSFVSSDLKAKIDLLREFLENSRDNFCTVKLMIQYEKENDLLNKNGYESGSRTLLRLHRGLDFIQLFLKKIGDLKSADSTSTACKEAYEQTLSQHHSFIIRSGARLAMFTLPTKDNLLKQVCGEDNVQSAMDMLPKTLEVSSSVHQRIEKLYTLHDLHSLP